MLKDNPIDGVFDFDEHPDVKFRSFIENRDNGELHFVQMDARLVPLVALQSYDLNSSINQTMNKMHDKPYFSRFIQFSPINSSIDFTTYHGRRVQYQI